jgi:hypothetical protein
MKIQTTALMLMTGLHQPACPRAGETCIAT